MTGRGPRPMRPIYEVSLDEEKSVIPTLVIGMKTSNYGHTTNPCDQLVSTLVCVVLLQVIREQDLTNLTLNPVMHTEAFPNN